MQSISNLCHVKYIFMKEKNKIKYVYHEEVVDNLRRRYVRFSLGEKKYLDEDFPYLCYLGSIITDHPVVVLRNISFDYGLGSGKAWIDKHGNAIVRIDNLFKQTKINF